MNAADADGWNHNNHYHDLLLAAVPSGCRRALDVGCGLGAFARRLATRATSVDAIDQDAVIQHARAGSPGSGRIRFVHADFMSWTADEPYDFISMIAVLHHLPFDSAVTKAAALLRPGGVLAVLGLHRARSFVHMGARGLVAHSVSAFYRMTRPMAPVGAPVRDPTMTLSEICREAEALLPGAAIQRHVLWRYSLTWVKPTEQTGSVSAQFDHPDIRVSGTSREVQFSSVARESRGAKGIAFD
jgi:2-polyprenyl-3-methyl-5-hydroxy-6-metoxy-1,4-benzoquinol methylase